MLRMPGSRTLEHIQEGPTALSIAHVLAFSFSVVSLGSEGNTSLYFRKRKVGYVGLHNHRHDQKLGNDTEAILPPRDILKLMSSVLSNTLQ